MATVKIFEMNFRLGESLFRGVDFFPSTNCSLKNRNIRTPPDFETGESSANARTRTGRFLNFVGTCSVRASHALETKSRTLGSVIPKGYEFVMNCCSSNFWSTVHHFIDYNLVDVAYDEMKSTILMMFFRVSRLGINQIRKLQGFLDLLRCFKFLINSSALKELSPVLDVPYAIGPCHNRWFHFRVFDIRKYIT